MSATRTTENGRMERVGAASPRASERVMEYLLAEFDRPELKEGSRLPTIRDLSVRLSVSQPTVHGVLQRLVKQGRVRTVAGSGTFLMYPRQKPSDHLNVALSLPLPTGQVNHFWSHRIGAAIMFAVCQSERRIKLVPLPRHVTSEEATFRKLLEERNQVDALILFPLEHDEEVRRAYEEAGKPVVDINPPSAGATANFVSTDYFGAGRQLATVWQRTGRKRMALLGNRLSTVSEHLRCAGFLAALGPHLGQDVSVRVIESTSIEEEAAVQAVRPLLTDRATAPDAIYCGGDHQALGALRTCLEHGFRVPEDVSIVGGTGLDLSESFCPQLTRLKQPFEKLGEELIAMLGQRIEQKNVSVPAKIISAAFMGGATTKPEENSALGIGESR